MALPPLRTRPGSHLYYRLPAWSECCRSAKYGPHRLEWQGGRVTNISDGIVLQNPAFFFLDLYPVVPGEVVSGTINGFLAPDR